MKIMYLLCPLIMLVFTSEKGLTTPKASDMTTGHPTLENLKEMVKGEKVYVTERDGTKVVLRPKCQSLEEYLDRLAQWATDQIPSKYLPEVRNGKGFIAEDMVYYADKDQLGKAYIEGDSIQSEGIYNDKSLLDVFRLGREGEYIAFFYLVANDGTRIPIDLFSCESGGCGNFSKRKNSVQLAAIPQEEERLEPTMPDTRENHPDYEEPGFRNDGPPPVQFVQGPMIMGGGGGLIANNGNTFAPSIVDNRDFSDNSVHTTITNPVVYDTVRVIQQDGPGNPPDPDGPSNPVDSGQRMRGPVNNGQRGRDENSTHSRTNDRNDGRLTASNANGGRNVSQPLPLRPQSRPAVSSSPTLSSSEPRGVKSTTPHLQESGRPQITNSVDGHRKNDSSSPDVRPNPSLGPKSNGTGSRDQAFSGSSGKRNDRSDRGGVQTGTSGNGQYGPGVKVNTSAPDRAPRNDSRGEVRRNDGQSPRSSTTGSGPRQMSGPAPMRQSAPSQGGGGRRR